MKLLSKSGLNRKLVMGITIPVLLTLILSFITVFYIFIPIIHDNMMNSKKEMVKELTQTVYSIIVDYDKQVERGEITLQEAQNEVKILSQKYRYGSEKKDYFWINDYNPVMIMHPYRPDLVNKDLNNYVDSEGKKLFVEFVEVVKKDGSGFVDYMWQWKDNDTLIVPKISYVVGYEKWGWIIGTGIYINDVNEEISNLTATLNLIFGSILGFITLLSVFILVQAEKAAKHIEESAEALKISEQNYRQIFNGTNEAIFIHDPETGEFVDVNDSACKMFGADRVEIISGNVGTFSDNNSGYTFENAKNLIRKANETGFESFEWKGKKQSGHEYWLEITLRPAIILGENRVLAVGREITERKLAQEALEKSERRYRQLIEKMNDGLASVDSLGRFTYVNPKFCEMIGFQEEDLKGEYVTNFLKPGFIKEFNDHFLKRREGDTEKYILYWNTSLNRTLITEISPQPIYTQNGEFKGSFAILTDITGRKKTEEELQKFSNFKKIITNLSAEFISIALNKIPSGIDNALRLLGDFIAVDRSFICLFNDDFTKISNSNEWCKDGFPSLKRYFQNIPVKKTSFMQVSILNSTPVIINDLREELRLSPDERQVQEQFSVKSKVLLPLLMGNKSFGQIGVDSIKYYREWKSEEIELLSIVGNIITNALLRKDYENSLLEAKNRAEKSEKLKSEFLAQISHEIRTPVNTILSFSSLIKEEVAPYIDEELKDSFYHMSSAGKRIIRTIDLILNMSEIQTGTYEYKRVDTDLLQDIVKTIYNEYKLLADQKGINIELSLQTFDTRIEVDRYTVGQIVANLLDNAIKYTENGTVELLLKKNELNNLVLEISDTGIGISKEYLPNLFSAFTQEEQGYTRKFEGNGLGLALVKKYCEMNSAKIEVDSIKGKGSTFRIIFS